MDGGILKGIGSMGNVVVESIGVFAPRESPGTITVGAGILNISLLDGFIPGEPMRFLEGAIDSMTVPSQR